MKRPGSERVGYGLKTARTPTRRNAAYSISCLLVIQNMRSPTWLITNALEFDAYRGDIDEQMNLYLHVSMRLANHRVEYIL